MPRGTELANEARKRSPAIFHTLFIIFIHHPGFSGQKNMCSYGDYGAHICTSFATRRSSSAGDNLAFVFAGHGICTTCTTSDRRDELDRAPPGRRVQCLLMLKNIKTIYLKTATLCYWRWAAPFSLFRSFLIFDTFVFLRFWQFFAVRRCFYNQTAAPS